MRNKHGGVHMVVDLARTGIEAIISKKGLKLQGLLLTIHSFTHSPSDEHMAIFFQYGHLHTYPFIIIHY